MRKLVIALLLVLAPLAAWAAPTLVRDEAPVIVSAGDKADPAFVCTLGSEYLSNTVGYYTFYQMGETYAVLIDPATCPQCNIGFMITRVRMLLRMNVGAFSASVGLREAVLSGPGCYTPGAVLASSGTFAGTIATAGGYFINLPWVTECIASNQKYFLTWTMVGATGPVGPYVDNDGATACRVYNDRGAGWVDLSGSFVGDVFLWAEMDCCEPPVPNDADSWSALKNLYR